MTVRTIALALALGLGSAVLVGCRAPQIAVREIAAPAAPGSAEPCVEAGGDGRVYLSWIEPAGSGEHALRFAVWEGSGWSEARTAAQGGEWFVNWADFPSVTALDDGTLAAHWLRKTGGHPYAYGVSLSFSKDRGESWSPPFSPHDDSPTEHGFVSKVSLPGGKMAAVWLDGRETGVVEDGHTGPMNLRSAVLAGNGRIEREDLIDDRVCDCCQTAAARAGDGGLVVAYRDRSENEIRDIAVVRFDGERWSEPHIVHDDGWEMLGCPVNGPALATDGERVAVAWFTAAGAAPTPRVRVAFSRDGGRSFGAPAEVDAGRPVGRVDVVFLEDGGALVTWIGEVRGAPQILARRVEVDGSQGPTLRIAATTSGRASGFPRTARLGRDAVITWTDPGDPSRVRTSVLSQGR